MAEWQVVCNKCGAVNISQVINKRIKELESEVESEKLRADLWMRYHDELKENREIIKNKLTKAEDILRLCYDFLDKCTVLSEESMEAADIFLTIQKFIYPETK